MLFINLFLALCLFVNLGPEFVERLVFFGTKLSFVDDGLFAHVLNDLVHCFFEVVEVDQFSVNVGGSAEAMLT